MKTCTSGFDGSKSGSIVRCGCSCISSTQWYTLQRSTSLQLMQMQHAGGGDRAAAAGARGAAPSGTV